MKRHESPHEYLHRRFLELERQSGRRRNLQWFANLLGVKQSNLSHLMNSDQVPMLETLIRMSKTLGTEIFEVYGVDLPRPLKPPDADDPQLRLIRDAWARLPAEARATILHIIEANLNESGNAEQPGSEQHPGEGESNAAGAGTGTEQHGERSRSTQMAGEPVGAPDGGPAK